jgi:hypothetical protein
MKQICINGTTSFFFFSRENSSFVGRPAGTFRKFTRYSVFVCDTFQQADGCRTSVGIDRYSYYTDVK